MKRLMTSTCLAAAFAVGLAAQTTGTSGTQDPPPGGQGRGPRPVTATGCLRAGDTAGSYQLTDVQMQGGGGRRGGDTGAATGTGTGTGEQRGRGNPPNTLMLTATSDVDLKPHVGHKIEVTGTMSGGGRRGGDAGAGSGTGTGTGAGSGGGQGRGSARSVTVTSVRMVSESCTQ